MVQICGTLNCKNHCKLRRFLRYFWGVAFVEDANLHANLRYIYPRTWSKTLQTTGKTASKLFKVRVWAR
eukprot:4279773-Amphidinium_carterae.1